MRRIRTLYLVIPAFLAVATVEGGLVAIALSAENQTISIWGASVVESIFIIAFIGYALVDLFGWNPRKLTADPLRAWMRLYALYWLASVLNAIILYCVSLYVVLGGKFQLNWILLIGFNFVFALASNFLVMRSLGQEYKSLGGSCLTGAASFARLARGMILSKNRYGINQLMLSIRMARGIFRSLSFVPHDMDAVSATLVSLKETGSWPAKELSDVARSLEELPKLDSLPEAFQNFLDKLSWPKGFDRIDTVKRYSDYPRLTIIFASIAALAAIVALFSEPIQQGVLQDFGTILVQSSMRLFGGLALLLDFVLIVRVRWWPVPLLALKYWPDEGATNIEA